MTRVTDFGMSRRGFMSAMGAAAACAMLPATLRGQTPLTRRGKPLNVLFLGVDDLRCELNCYGAHHIHSPNIDALAESGTAFLNAHVQQPVCSASRASLLTGCRPDTTTVDYPYSDYFVKEFLPGHPTIATQYQRAGYYTRGFGKIHHGSPLELLHCSEPYYGAGNWRESYALPENNALVRDGKRGPAYEMADLPDTAYKDGRIGDEVVATLGRAAQQDKPFFLAAGFLKPHLPFVAPKRYWDLYDRDKLPMTPVPYRPSGAPPYATATYELPTYAERYAKDGAAVPEDVARTLRHAYFACVSLVDAQIGKVLAALDRLGLRDSTLVMFWSDHGFHLGDQGAWGKHMVYEYSSHAPLIVSGPGLAKGQRCEALVEYVDMYPTLCELSGFEKPAYLEGTSFTPLLANPRRAWKRAAFSQYPRGPQREGYAIRTQQHRYIEWRKPDGTIEARELYNHQADPYEATSVAESQPVVADRLAKQLHAGWKAALPAGV